MSLFLVISFISFVGVSPAHALDKRLKLLFKTSGYGAAAGGVIGLGTYALGIGNYRNVLMGASAGMYAGILLAAYIVAVPDEDDLKKRYRGPRRPIGNDDWEEEDNDEEILREHVPVDREEDEGMRDQPFRYQMMASPSLNLYYPSQLVSRSFWMPVFTLQF